MRNCEDARTQETVRDVPVTTITITTTTTHHAHELARTCTRAREKKGEREEKERKSDAAVDAAMRLGPIILSWATATAGWLGPSNGITATAMARALRSRDYELSTEFFLVPSEIGHGLASVASVISVPAPNRTITVFRTPPGVRKSQEVDMRPTPKSLLKQRPWALPLAALSAAAMLLMAGFEIFVLFKVGSELFNN